MTSFTDTAAATEPSLLESALMPLLGIACGTLLTLLLVAVIVAVAVRIRKQQEDLSCSDERIDDDKNSDDREECVTQLPPTSATSDLILLRRCVLLDETIDGKLTGQLSSPTSPRNPDVIPSLGGFSPQRYELDPLASIKVHEATGLDDEVVEYALYPLTALPSLEPITYELVGGLYHERPTVAFDVPDPTTNKYEMRADVLCTPARVALRPSAALDNTLAFYSQTLPRRPLTVDVSVSCVLFMTIVT